MAAAGRVCEFFLSEMKFNNPTRRGHSLSLPRVAAVRPLGNKMFPAGKAACNLPREMCRGSLSKGKSRERTLRSDSISKISVNLREGTILECYVNIEYANCCLAFN